MTFEGRQLSNASDAERMRVSTAIGFQSYKEGDVRIMLFKRGSLLDAQALEALGIMAEEAEATTVIEIVGEGEGCHIVMRDGEMANA